MLSYFMAFVIGGALCLLAQLVMDLTKPEITPGHILVGYVTIGAILSAIGLYQPLVNLGGREPRFHCQGSGTCWLKVLWKG